MFGISEMRKYINEKQYMNIMFMLFVYLAYVIGIIQDIALGISFLKNIVEAIPEEGSFPFMIGWGIVMIWALIKPIERRGILLCTSILVMFMLVNDLLIQKGNSEFPVIRIFGILLWLVSYILAIVLKSREKIKTSI